MTVRDSLEQIQTQYVGGMTAEGNLFVGRLDPGNTLTRQFPSDLSPRDQDVMMQIDVIDDTVSFWAWGDPDAEKPEDPVWSFRDTAISDGFVTVNFGSSLDGDVSGFLRFVQVDTVSIPEPSSALLLSVGMFAMIRAGRRKRSDRLR